MEAVAQKYRDKADFLFVYCREAHPEGGPGGGTRTKQNKPIPQAMTPDERRETARQFCADMQATRRILVDDFAWASVQQLYGGMPNPTFVVDVDGKIALKLAWTNGAALGDFLPRFLAGGARLDVALANSVPSQGPPGGGGDGRLGGFGGVGPPGGGAGFGAGPSGGPGGPMMAPMIDRMLQGLTLTEAEAMAARSTLQAKMERRGMLRQQAVALGELARGNAKNEADLARATQEFEAAVTEYQQQMARFDRELGAKVSAKAKAQLLAAGVFENGIGLTGPGPGPGFGPPNGPPQLGGGDGPWNHRVLLATSRDGMNWTVRDESLAERASVPELFAGPDGRAIVLFVDADAGGLGARRERADGTWERVSTNLGGVDPNVVRLKEGGYRAYVKAGREGAMDAFASEDGLTWRRLGEVFRDARYRFATDPDVFQTPDGWVMLLSLGPQLLRCTSTDGLHFTAGETLDLGGSVSDTVAVAGGWRTYFHVNGDPRAGARMSIRSAFTADGRTWKAEEGVRVSPPAQGPARMGVADPAPLQRADGTWLMAVKSFIAPSQPGPPPLPQAGARP
jgi:hypothetical protein